MLSPSGLMTGSTQLPQEQPNANFHIAINYSLARKGGHELTALVPCHRPFAAPGPGPQDLKTAKDFIEIGGRSFLSPVPFLK